VSPTDRHTSQTHATATGIVVGKVLAIVASVVAGLLVVGVGALIGLVINGNTTQAVIAQKVQTIEKTLEKTATAAEVLHLQTKLVEVCTRQAGIETRLLELERKAPK
jgi:hypothetical protein